MKQGEAFVVINVAGGAIVAEGFDEDDGWVSAGVASGTLRVPDHQIGPRVYQFD